MVSKHGRKLLYWLREHRLEWFFLGDILRHCPSEVDVLTIQSLVDANYIERFLDPHDDFESPDPFAAPPYAYRIREEGLGYLEDFRRQHLEVYINRALAILAIVVAVIALFK